MRGYGDQEDDALLSCACPKGESILQTEGRGLPLLTSPAFVSLTQTSPLKSVSTFYVSPTRIWRFLSHNRGVGHICPPRVVRLYIIPLFTQIFELFYLSACSETSTPSNHTNKLAELCLIASVFKDPSWLPVRFREFFHNSQFLPYPPFNSPGASTLPLLTSVNKLN